jgi:hypothetical protein
MRVILPKYFYIVRVWLYLTVSKLDFNVLVIPTVHFGLDMCNVLCPITLASVFEIGV